MEAINLAGANVPNVQGALGSGSVVQGALPADAAEIGAFVAALLAQTMQPVAAAAADAVPAAEMPAAMTVAAGAGSVLPDPRQLFAAREASPASPALGRAQPMLSSTSASRPEGDWSPLVANVAAAGEPALQQGGLKAAPTRSLPEPGFEGEARAVARHVPAAALIFAADAEAATTQAMTGDAESPLVQTLQRLSESGTVQHAYTEKPSPLPMRDPALFAERLNQQVAVMITQHAQQARLAVNPPELGPVEVRVTVIGDEATIQLAATHAATREALEEALPRLRAAFADSGIALGHAGVFTEMPDRRPDPRQPDGGTAAAADLGQGPNPDEPPLLARVQLGLVDAFV